MNIEQSSEIRNALTVIKGRTEMARIRLNALPMQTSTSAETLFMRAAEDLLVVYKAIERVMAVVEQLEQEAGIGVVAATVPRP